MPKRKRGTGKFGAYLAQEPSAPPPLRKSARLLERESHQILPVHKGKKQRKENERCRALPSSSTTGSTREDRCPTLLSENNTEKPTDDTSFENHFGNARNVSFGLGAGHKRKHEKELDQAGIESRKQTPKSETAAASPNLYPKERLKLPGDDGLSKKQKLQPEETVPKTNIPVIESREKPAKKLGVRDPELKERHGPISYWAVHHTWPKNFTEHNPMASSNSTNKRQRTSDRSQSGKDERSRSYSQSRKDGEVPEQYTAAYERHILTKGLDMDPFKGEELVSEESKKLCIDLQQITHKTIEPTIFPTGAIRKVINFCRNRNEAIVNRDVTPMIMPPITSLYFGGDNSLEHVIDEVNADWYDQCVLEGPRLHPDLAIGLFSSAFTEGEIDKLRRYTSVDNWTQTTMHMFFPFLMCEVKCGREGLDIADRQNMHSCSVAVRAILRIEQEADKYRPEKKTDSLISLLAIHNFVRNILKSYYPGHVRRLEDTLAALPDPNKPPESSGLSGSSGLSFVVSGISLSDDNSQQDSQDRDADGFVVPAHPGSSQNSEAKKKGQESRLVERIDKLIEENRRQRQEHKEEIERQRKESEEKMDKLLRQFLGKAAN